MKLFDAHCHLQDSRLQPDIAGVMQRAAEAGVAGMSCCGAGEDEWEDVLTFSRHYPGVVPSFGLHPWYVSKRTASWLSALAGYLETPGSAVGETGLDHAIRDANREDQEKVFLAQWELARDLNKPVTLHCRQAWGRLLEILKWFGPSSAGALIHSYSGSAELVPELSRLGMCFSFSGSMTWERNARGRAALVSVAADRLLIETDSPDLTPSLPALEHTASDQPPAPNEPANLVCILREAARLRNVTENELAAVTWDNGCRLFGVTR